MNDATHPDGTEETGFMQKRISALENELEAARQLELKYRALIEEIPEGIAVVQDNPLRLVYVNAAMTRLTGCTAPELLAASPEQITRWVHEKDHGAFSRIFQELMNGFSIPGTAEFRCLPKDGEMMWLAVAARSVEYEGKRSVLAVCMDVTERRLKEERAEKMERRVRQAQKMDAVETLAGGIAHGFNNLLMGIQGYTSLMLIDMDPGQPHYEKLRSIEDQVRSGAELTRQLLGFARAGRYEVMTLSLNELIRKCSAMFGSTNKELTIHWQLGQNIWRVEADREQIEKVLTTLFINAWQAMPGGGELTIETSNARIGEDHLLPYQVSPGRYVRVAVSDTGMGMDEQTQQRIFDPFFTTKTMGRGTGLGLATVYGIVKGHGGFIQVESAPGQGATFTFFLPASTRRRPADREVPVARENPRARETILVVDDEPANMEVTKEILESLNYDVHTASNGMDAVAFYQDYYGDIDLVILDMIMPGMGGGETFDRLKQIDPHVRVLLSSGYSLEGQAQDILNRGCLGFIQKPYKIEELAEKIRDIVS
jgi:two-component system, cell cycle sensor histidine kinase and response regulator CckA